MGTTLRKDSMHKNREMLLELVLSSRHVLLKNLGAAGMRQRALCFGCS